MNCGKIPYLLDIVNDKFWKSCETPNLWTMVHKSNRLDLSRIFIVQNCQRLKTREAWTTVIWVHDPIVTRVKTLSMICTNPNVNVQ